VFSRWFAEIKGDYWSEFRISLLDIFEKSVIRPKDYDEPRLEARMPSVEDRIFRIKSTLEILNEASFSFVFLQTKYRVFKLSQRVDLIKHTVKPRIYYSIPMQLYSFVQRLLKLHCKIYLQDT
jgi:hypothetical protein